MRPLPSPANRAALASVPDAVLVTTAGQRAGLLSRLRPPRDPALRLGALRALQEIVRNAGV